MNTLWGGRNPAPIYYMKLKDAVYNPKIKNSPYEQAITQGVDKQLNLKRCKFCKGKGHIGVGVCINCEGYGGVKSI